MQIITTDRFLLESSHNGLFYTLYNRDTVTSIFVQGEDAATLHDDIEALETLDLPYDTILASIWHYYSP